MEDLKRFFRLVNLELIKLFSWKNILAFLAIIVLLNAGLLWIFNTDIDDATKDYDKKMKSATNWKEKIEVQIEANKSLEDLLGKDKVRMSNEILQYRLDHNIPPLEGHNAWDYLSYTSSFINLAIVIFIIYLASKIYSVEIDNHMEDFIFSQDYSRSYLLHVKMVSMLFSVLILLLLSSVLTFVIGGISYGFEDSSAKMVYYFNHKIYLSSFMKRSFFQFVLWLLSAIAMGSISLSLTELFKGGMMPRIISILYFLFGLTLSNKLIDLTEKPRLLSYTFLPYSNLVKFLDTPMNEAYRFGKGVIFLFGLAILLYLASHFHLNKRDIA